MNTNDWPFTPSAEDHTDAQISIGYDDGGQKTGPAYPGFGWYTPNP